MRSKKIAIIGHGFVGKATEFGFSKNSKIFIVDPKVNTSIFEIKDFSPDFIFVCVPTPMNKSGSQDFSIVQDVFEQIKLLKVDSCVILKSTVTPENIIRLKISFQTLYTILSFLEKVMLARTLLIQDL